jgi:hypothetical protein
MRSDAVRTTRSATAQGGFAMPVEAHLAVLKEKHAALDRLIWDEEQRPWPNEMEIMRLKLEKLRLKEAIDRLSKPVPGAPE